MSKKNPLPANSNIQKKKKNVRPGLRPIRVAPTPGCNELCPCGSKKKFKKCCVTVPSFLGPRFTR